MRRVKLNEILEECLGAVLEGRRTVDDCLSLYPQLAPELEPLLSTALEVTDAFQTESPSWHTQERVRLRVLAAHQARVRSRNLVSGVDLARSGPWRTRHWGLLGAAAAAVVGAVIVGSTMIFTGGDGGGGQSVSNPPDGGDVVVISLVDTVDEARDALASDGSFDRDFLRELLSRAEALSTTYSDQATIEAADPETRDLVVSAINEIEVLLNEPSVAPTTPEEEDIVRDLAEKNKQLAEDWGVTPTGTPIITGTPEPSSPASPTPTGEPTVTPEPTPTKAPTATPTPAPTAPPTATPGPTPTPDGSGGADPIRELQ